MLAIRGKSSDESTVALLTRNIGDLQSQLQRLQTETETLRQNYETSCSISLGKALASLLAFSDGVLYADAEVIAWHKQDRSKRRRIRKVLHIGKQEHTSVLVIIGHETASLCRQVDAAGAKFAATGQVCGGALSEVQKLNRRVNDYAKTSVGVVQDDVWRALEGFEREQDRVRAEIADKELETDRLEGNIEDTAEGVDRTAQAIHRTEGAADNAVGVTVGSALGSFLFGGIALVRPPVALVAGVAGAVAGAASLGGSIAHAKLRGDARELSVTHDELSTQLDELYSEIRVLRAQLVPLQNRAKHYGSVVKQIEVLGSDCEKLRRGASSLSRRLGDDRAALTRAKAGSMKLAAGLKGVAAFARMRGGVADELLEMMQDLKSVCRGFEGGQPGARGKTIEACGTIQSRVDDIQGQTPRVLMILEKAG